MTSEILKHRSGRVIALGRSLLALIFLFAIWIDPTQPAVAEAETYATLAAYAVVVLGVMALTWNDWWLDAKLVAATHILDIGIFGLLVYATAGYTSPFFVFFVFLLLSAAIRWGWRETTATAIAVTFLYLAAGLLAAPEDGTQFELQRFIIRSGHMVILSAILILFATNHGFSGLGLGSERLLPEPSPDHPPMQAATRGAIGLAGASTGVLLWRAAGVSNAIAIVIDGDSVRQQTIPRSAAHATELGPFLFDLRRDRALCRSPQQHMRFFAPKERIKSSVPKELGIEEGLAIPIHSEAGEGLLLLGGIDGLSVDHLQLGAALADAIAMHIQRHALLGAVKESATARARLSLARDLHDSIVQFLAGATFRIEAITRSLNAGGHPESELRDLKQLLLLEQQELRSAIGALRKDRVSLADLAADLRELCSRLSRQWDIQCSFSGSRGDRTVAMRVHLDTHQLIREAVANAVRHARTKSVKVQMVLEESALRLDIGNDGGGKNWIIDEKEPWSLSERVAEADGTLLLASGEFGTTVSITLPLGPEEQS